MDMTVPEAAKRLGRNPETIRRWIREGKLRSRKVGTQHLLLEEDVEALTSRGRIRVPSEWETTVTGENMPNWVQIVHRSRALH
jgi:excisionase family DNA binding protein